MFTSETFLDVRYYETDLMGIVHHSNYIRYFECGRNDALIKLGIPITAIEAAGIMMPVVSVNCVYKIPAKNGDRLRIVSTISEMPKARKTIRSESNIVGTNPIKYSSVTIRVISERMRVLPTREFLFNRVKVIY